MKAATGPRRVHLNEIVVRNRARRDLGDIDKLAASINELGLLHPLVVRPGLSGEWLLVAGERRLAAMRKLGRIFTTVTVAMTVDDEVLALRMERDENTCRKDLAPSEMVSLADQLEPRLREEARQRQGTRTDLEPSANLAPSKARDAVAEAVGVGHETLRKAREVVHLAEAPEAPAPVREVAREAAVEMDRTGKVDPAFRKVRQLDELLANDPDVALATWRKNFGRDLGRVVRLVTWDAEQVAAKQDDWESWDHLVRGLQSWIADVERHRPKAGNLRVVGGDST